MSSSQPAAAIHNQQLVRSTTANQPRKSSLIKRQKQSLKTEAMNSIVRHQNQSFTDHLTPSTSISSHQQINSRHFIEVQLNKAHLIDRHRDQNNISSGKLSNQLHSVVDLDKHITLFTDKQIESVKPKSQESYRGDTMVKESSNDHSLFIEKKDLNELGEGGYNTDEEDNSPSRPHSRSPSSSSSGNSSSSSDEHLSEQENFQYLKTESFYSEQGNEYEQIVRVDSDLTHHSSSVSNIYSSGVPPPNPLLPRSMIPDESVHNGFARKFIEIKRHIEFEKDREPLGIVKDPKFVQQTQKIDDQNSNPGTETSLRHFFYMEYRKNNTEPNPIVYSRYGKTHYESEEKFSPDSFSQLIRTCNIKNLINGLPGDVSEQKQAAIVSLKDYHRQKEEGNTFIRSYQQQSAPTRSYYIPRSINDNTLVFESRFESGNLQLAHKISDYEYNLILQNDVNSKGHTQWFYFRIQNTRKNQKIKFNLLNFLKSKSLYNNGMKISILSEKKLEHEQTGWHKGGESIIYFQNNYRREHMTNYQRCYYTMSFTYKFEYDNDTVYFAYSQPYTYSDLKEDLSAIEKLKLDYVTRNTLCRTIAGNRCEYLTITSRNQQNEQRNLKKGVVISARVHPGESNSSWMMKGVIDFLISDSVEAQILRNNFVFKIIPMLNPDGVINGNYRCSLAGCDLNRRWKFPSPIIHPTIYHAKKLIKQFAAERPLALFCDLHGHSRRKNIFIYGNSEPHCPESTRVFPFLLSKINDKHFSYDYSRFNVQRNKEQTARITMWRELRVPNVFTLEASFCGPQSIDPKEQNKFNYHFSTQDLLEIGKNLCQTLLFYCNNEVDIDSQIEEIREYHKKSSSSQVNPNQATNLRSITSKIDTNLNQNKTGLIKKSLQTIEKRDEEIKISKFQVNEILDELQKKIVEDKKRRGSQIGLDQETSSGSDSEPSEDNLDASELVKIMPKRQSKKKQGNKQRKRNQLLNAVNNNRKTLKDDIDKKDEDFQSVEAVKKRNFSNRGVQDFKKPTQSYLSKYSVIPGKKKKYLLFPKGKTACTQTSDKEEGSDYELSAMEKDIWLCTGCKPGKLTILKKQNYDSSVSKLRVLRSFAELITNEKRVLSPKYDKENNAQREVQVLFSKQVTSTSNLNSAQKENNEDLNQSIQNSTKKSYKIYKDAMETILEDKTNQLIVTFNDQFDGLFPQKLSFANIQSINSGMGNVTKLRNKVNQSFTKNIDTSSIVNLSKCEVKPSKTDSSVDLIAYPDCNYSQQKVLENNQFSCRINSQNRDQQNPVNDQYKLVKRMPYRRKIHTMFNSHNQTLQNPPQQPALIKKNSQADSLASQKVLLPQMCTNSGSNLFQLSPIIQMIPQHLRVQQRPDVIQNSSVLEKIDEKVQQQPRSVSSNQYNRGKRSRLNELISKGTIKNQCNVSMCLGPPKCDDAYSNRQKGINIVQSIQQRKKNSMRGDKGCVVQSTSEIVNFSVLNKNKSAI